MDEALNGLRILAAEDEGLVALAIESILTGFGCTVVGPIATVERAVQLAREEPLDGALLDVNLRGSTVFPAADALLARGVPVILSTGYDDVSMFPERFRTLPRVVKPFDEERLGSVMRETFVKA